MQKSDSGSLKEQVTHDLVLIGGGHSHVEVIKRFGMRPAPGVRITLIARDVMTPYSGMLPGLIAGNYSYDETHIDLRPLCQFANARLFHDEVIGLDLASNKVICRNRPDVKYDLLSINVGSRPQLDASQLEHKTITPVKPINRFVNKWDRLMRRILDHEGRHSIAIVGAGAAGVELTLAVQHRIRQLIAKGGHSDSKLELHLISRSDRILPRFSKGVAKRFERVLKSRDISVYTSCEAHALESGKLSLQGRDSIAVDEVLWATGASAPQWIADSGLAVDEHGFISVNDALQSISHPHVFASGDVSHVSKYPREKAGVIAVRQGPPLAKNLRRMVDGERPVSFKPQRTMLGLISTGDRYAIASKGWFHFEGRFVWTWKDWIDRRWMRKYIELPVMDPPASSPARANSETSPADSDLALLQNPVMRCGGCGAKVGADLLSRALADIHPIEHPDVVVGLKAPDDAAIIDVPEGKAMVQTVDYFRSFIDDPFLLGQIAANHALSDLFAMGAQAQTALAIATIPYGSEEKVEETLRQLMLGAIASLNDAGAALVGGHTSEGQELACGFSVNGLIDKDEALTKSGLRIGHRLILTKALGTGALFAANMQYRAKGPWIESALASMLQSNQKAAQIIHAHNAGGCTDITGFGLLGHLVEMTRASLVGARIDLNAVPCLDGAVETIANGISSSLQPANLRLRRVIRESERHHDHEKYPLLFDPQTAGGLLASIPEPEVDQCLIALRQAGYGEAVVVGDVTSRGSADDDIELIS